MAQSFREKTGRRIEILAGNPPDELIGHHGRVIQTDAGQRHTLEDRQMVSGFAVCFEFFAIDGDRVPVQAGSVIFVAARMVGAFPQ